MPKLHATLLAWTLALVLVGSPQRAAADIMPSGGKKVSYTYEIANLKEHPEATFVVWPRTCDSDGSPVGKVDLGMNPQMAGRLHDPDYEALQPGPRQLLHFCASTARIYALDAKAFPTDARKADKDNWALGWKTGDAYLGVAALDAMTIQARMPFFASDRRARRADYAFEYVLVLRRASPIATIHDVLTIASLDAEHVVIAPVKVRYGYVDGTTEELAWTGGKHPRPPGRTDALKAPVFGSGGADDVDYGAADTDASSSADAGAPASLDAGASLAATPPTPPEPSSPWPLRIVLVGLVAGSAFAFGLRARGASKPPP